MCMGMYTYLAPFCCEPVFCCRPVNVESTNQNLTARLGLLVPKPSPALHDRQGRVQSKGKPLSQETPREGEVGRGQGWPKGASGSALCMIHVQALPSRSVLLRTGVLLSPCECIIHQSKLDCAAGPFGAQAVPGTARQAGPSPYYARAR